MGKSERIAYMCGGRFIYQGDMVLVPKSQDPLSDALTVGIVLGLSSIVKHEPHNHIRVMTEQGVVCVPRRDVFPYGPV